jgi:hypothetical protein
VFGNEKDKNARQAREASRYIIIKEKIRSTIA